MLSVSQHISKLKEEEVTDWPSESDFSGSLLGYQLKSNTQAPWIRSCLKLTVWLNHQHPSSWVKNQDCKLSTDRSQGPNLLLSCLSCGLIQLWFTFYSTIQLIPLPMRARIFWGVFDLTFVLALLLNRNNNGGVRGKNTTTATKQVEQKLHPALGAVTRAPSKLSLWCQNLGIHILSAQSPLTTQSESSNWTAQKADALQDLSHWESVWVCVWQRESLWTAWREYGHEFRRGQ